ncbi:hypothetical protein PG997_000620 [Apiospora hydei]|uniref:Uncharacterized protein n=1 Tax=Apiospora hydei TaxID=1337664 RepID=A0ABR1XB71_9PEZI
MAPKKTTGTASGSGPAAPGATPGGTDAAPILNAAETEFLIAYFQHCTAAAKPDPIAWQALGAQFGLHNKKNVNQRFNRLCAKLNWFSAAVPAGVIDPATPAKSKGGRPKKVKGLAAASAAKHSAANDDDGADADAEAEDSDCPSPAKKRKVEDDGMDEA